jgi:hypothetical protein
MQDTLAVIKKDGDSGAISHQHATFDERENIIGTKHYLK